MKNRMHNCQLYLPDDPEIMAEQTACQELQYEYNLTRPHEGQKRAALLQKMFAQIGPNCYIEPPPACQLGWSLCPLRKKYLCQLQPDPGG